MPKVSVNSKLFLERIGRPDLADDDLAQLCFRYGIELDDVTSERKMATDMAEKLDDAAVAQLSNDKIYRIDIPANRYDLLCLEGIAQGLNIFDGKFDVPNYRAVKPAAPLRLKIEAATNPLRPHCVAAVLRNITFTAESYKSFIDLQDKLHQNICRKRQLVAIGTHDLDTIEGPFTYTALAPKKIRFVPLSKTEEVDGEEMMKMYENSHLREYLPLISHSDVYPVIYDAKGRVLSVPPIINGNHSKITLNTRNVFIECTARDLTKAKVVLNTVIAMFSGYCSPQFECEIVEVEQPDGRVIDYPDFTPPVLRTSAAYINSCTGLDFDSEHMVQLLRKLQLPAKAEGAELVVQVPITRSDVLHACDIMEDVAIAHGYDNLSAVVPPTLTVGSQTAITQLTDAMRIEMLALGYVEVLTFVLSSIADNFYKPQPKTSEERLKYREFARDHAVVVQQSYPDTECARTTLLPGMLKTVASNSSESLPLQLFEISDVVLLDKENYVGASNERRLCATYTCSVKEEKSGFETIHGCLDRMLMMLETLHETSTQKSKRRYRIEKHSEPQFVEGKCAAIFVDGQRIGVFGMVQPDVLKLFNVRFPTTALEMSVKPFYKE